MNPELEFLLLILFLKRKSGEKLESKHKINQIKDEKNDAFEFPQPASYLHTDKHDGHNQDHGWKGKINDIQIHGNRVDDRSNSYDPQHIEHISSEDIAYGNLSLTFQSCCDAGADLGQGCAKGHYRRPDNDLRNGKMQGNTLGSPDHSSGGQNNSG